MRKRRSLFRPIVIVLVLAMVIPMAASAGLGSTTATPTPVVATATPIIGDNTDLVPAETTDTESSSMTTVDGALALPGGVFNFQIPEGGPDPQAMEDFRTELFSLADMLNKLLDEAYPTAKVNGRQLAPAVKMDQQPIQELTHEELYIIRQALDASSVELKALESEIKTLRSIVSTSLKGSREGEEGLGPSLGSFTVIPTPAPVPLDTMHHDTLENANSKNIEAGDIFIKEGGNENQTPAYPTDVGCPKDFYDSVAIWTIQKVIDALELARSWVELGCVSVIVVCPVPGEVGANFPSCIAAAVVDGLFATAKAILNGFSFCNGGIVSAQHEAIFNNTQILHSDLIDHEKHLNRRANAIDRFIFDFRNLNLRTRIEANLASPEDDPISLLTLPSSICIKEDPEPGGFNVEIVGKPNDPLTPERLRRCGLLEVVSDTVRSTIDMNLAAGQSVNNAEAEFQAAVAHFDAGEWKLSYARFRKAFREAVRP
jgi:hypothetical protein